jgi:D-glycero-D-manno-heptose 1,7-bisphosphate phosphatase
MKRAVFLDRDGVINRVILKGGRPFSPRNFKQLDFLDGVKEVLTKLRGNDFLNIVITNQPDIARGLMRLCVLQKINDVVREKLAVDDIFVCPHDDIDNCHCRKPKPGMLLDAATKWDINLTSSFLIGDQWKDIEAGRAAGCTTILLDYPYNRRVVPDFRVDKLQHAAQIILTVGGTDNHG